jgi:microcin C transport system permease protein
VLARLIYGFRLSVLFGLTLTIISSVIGIAAGAVQGYFGGWTDLLFQRFIEIWTSIPSLYLLLIFSAFFVPGILDAALHPAAVQLGCACRPGAGGVPARAQS